MLEKRKSSLDKKKYVGALSTDLSKALDTTNHELLIAKLVTYGFSHKSLNLMLSYLKNRSQRV